MDTSHKLTIVHSTFLLNSYPIAHLDQETVSVLQSNIPAVDPHRNLRNPLIRLLDCYLGITNQSLTFPQISQKHVVQIFQGFLGAILSDTFVKAEVATRVHYAKVFTRALMTISRSFPNLLFSKDSKAFIETWHAQYKDPLMIEFYQGWRISNKQGILGGYLRLSWLWKKIGPVNTRALHSSAVKFSEKYVEKSKGNYLPVINDLFSFLESSHPDIDSNNLNNPNFSVQMLENFCRYFFQQKVMRQNCLATTIKRWNDAMPFLEHTLFGSGVFAKPFRKFPYIEPSRKSGSESKINRNDAGLEVKDKLLIEVPLHLTDDEVITLLFEKINDSVEIVLNWAEKKSEEMFSKFRSNGSKFDFMDFNLEASQIKAKYRTTKLRGARATDIADSFGLPTSYSLDPFLYILINEHPEITESFLLSLRVYDKNGTRIGLIEVDGVSRLVGQKLRRGQNYGSQKIALSEKALICIERIILLTEPLRQYLRAQGDDNYGFLLLTCRRGFSYPKPITSSVRLSGKSPFNARIEEFKSFGSNLDDKSYRNLVQRLTFTRFRATVGLQVYLETGSGKAMAKALGHAKYKPELLSHYLPESILMFFQSRWIRIFQKGIICEAFKNNKLLLRASNFQTLDELNQFLTKHIFKLPIIETSHNPNSITKQVYLTLNENCLIALLSLKSAVVNSPNPSQISGYAKYWSKFASLLENEIENNRHEAEIYEMLKSSQYKANANTMKNIIYKL